jgi:hypothetical protein
MIITPSYIRVATFAIDEVIPFVFTYVKQQNLEIQGYKYTDPVWINASKRAYTIIEYPYQITIKMGSHRYQLFALKGTNCVRCGLKGKFFALEKCIRDKYSKPHFNLYGVDKNGHEVMLTKDHIIPKSKGGKNILTNYQPLCIHCNQHKADKIEKC